MMISLISLYSAGVLTLSLAVFHTQFYKRFGWEREYVKVNAVNHRIFYTIHIALTTIFFLFGLLTIWYAAELSQCSGLAMGVNIALSIFWLWRFVWQLIYFSKARKKIISILLTFWFFVLFLGYLVPILRQVLNAST